MTLSVVVLTRNEEKNIRECLAAVRPFADEMLVFDSLSTDDTVALAREAGARVESRQFDNYAGQRNASMAAARGEWIFFIDADERADEAVGREIKSEIARIEQESSDTCLFWIPRKNYIFGKWIQHTGWSPDYQPRILRRGLAHFDPARPVHELVIAAGGDLYLKCSLIHYNYQNLAQFRKKQVQYTKYEAQQMYQQGIRPRLRSYIGMPIREFVRRYFSLKGYRDGLHGLSLSALMAYYAFWRQVWLAELWQHNS